MNSGYINEGKSMGGWAFHRIIHEHKPFLHYMRFLIYIYNRIAATNKGDSTGKCGAYMPLRIDR